jgi:putative RNA 2'-phosphotransferase
MDREQIRISKFLSLVLRHDPQVAGLSLDRGGWVDIDRLLAGAAGAGVRLTREMLCGVVEMGEKKRFTISEDGLRIKANYGHSIPVDLALEPSEPPDTLFHGTATHLLESIRQEGIKSKGRYYVHLSTDEPTAASVGSRHGDPVVLRVQARSMHADGFEFFLCESGIWLTRSVPPHYLEFPVS